jgi:RHS repeat-associated protein
VTNVSYGPSGALKGYTLGNGKIVQISLDIRNRPTLIGGANFSSGLMKYDGDGNITDAGTRKYMYDAYSRLTKVRDPGQRGTYVDRETMTYDRWGNLTQRENLWTGETVSLPVDIHTNRLEEGTYDARGNLQAMGSETFRYDVKGRKHEYEVTGSKMRYLYDGGDERVSKSASEPGNAPLKRREMARIVVQALGLSPITSCVTPTFGDVPCADPDWGYIQKMYEIGITSGCGSGNFCPENPVAREEMAVFVMRTKYYVGAKPILVPAPTEFPVWCDVTSENPYAFYINRAYQDQVTSGCVKEPPDCPNNENPLHFCPANPTSAWEMELLITRARPRTVVLKPSATYTLREPGNRVVTEYRDTERKRDNVYLGNQLVASVTYAWNTTSKTWTKGWEYYASDHLGTPRTATNQSGGLLEAKEYLAYGELKAGSPSIQRKSFALMERDDEGFGKSFFDHARDYHSRLGRFTSPDQLQGRPGDPQSWNRYTYARNNPLKYVDPDGKAIRPVTGAGQHFAQEWGETHAAFAAAKDAFASASGWRETAKAGWDVIRTGASAALMEASIMPGPAAVEAGGVRGVQAFSRLIGGKGILGEMDSAGVVRFAVEAGEGSAVRGTNLFREMMSAFGSAAKVVEGNWLYGSNLAKVNQLTKAGMSLEAAAAQTWTGKRAAELGFKAIRIVSTEGSAGAYTSVVVQYAR